MHPQYMPQQYSGLPPGGFGQGGLPGASRPSPSVTPGSYQQPLVPQGGPPMQRMGPSASGFPQGGGRAPPLQGSQNTGVPNGPSMSLPGSQ
ncbi:hypothetical protein PR048_029146, partial [Dryococelus australis]